MTTTPDEVQLEELETEPSLEDYAHAPEDFGPDAGDI